MGINYAHMYNNKSGLSDEHPAVVVVDQERHGCSDRRAGQKGEDVIAGADEGGLEGAEDTSSLASPLLPWQVGNQELMMARWMTSP